jgi:hypothetical protein
MSKIHIDWSKLIPLTEDSISKLDNNGGVYRISKKADDGKFYVFFVGSAENVKEKLLSHISDTEENLRLKNYINQGGDLSFRWAPISERNIQSAIEKQMYNLYLPSCNLEEPRSLLDVEANLN